MERSGTCRTLYRGKVDEQGQCMPVTINEVIVAVMGTRSQFIKKSNDRSGVSCERWHKE